MGGGPRQTHAASFPPDRFYCLLDELPLHLIPQPALRRLQKQTHNDHPLLLNPESFLRSQGEVPKDVDCAQETLREFALQGTTAWVRDPVCGSLLPFWLGPKLEAAVRRLKAGQLASPALAVDARMWLAGAGILVPADYAAHKMEKWEQAAVKAAPSFQQKGYAPIGELIHPFHLAALRRYYRYLIRTGRICLGDGQSPRRYVAYNDPVASFFHRCIAAKLSRVAGQPLKPSYVYLASYLSGAELRKHIDREQCEFSLTLCLDFSPEPVLETSWPIKLQTPGGTVTVYQALGDALAYRGTRLPHYRDVLPEGRTSTSIFFHYVAADFTGSLH